MTALTWDDFLDVFFGASNELSLAQAQGDTEPGRLMAPWLEERRFLAKEPIALVRRRGTAFDIYWLVFSSRQSREVAATAAAFVGSAYVPLGGTIHRMDRRDEIEDVAWKLTAGHAFRMRIADSNGILGALRALDLARNVWEQRPPRLIERRRPIGRILRDFELAIQAERFDLVGGLLDEAKRSRQLSSVNLLFLRVRALAGEKRWEDLLQLPELTGVADISRPSRVTGDLLAAVYETHLSSLPVDDMKAHFVEKVRPSYAWLFRGWAGHGSSAALRAYALHLATSDPPQSARLRELQQDQNFAEDQAFLRELDVEPAELPGIQELFRSNLYEDAYIAAASLSPSLDSVEALLRCAIELERLEVVQSLISHVEALDEADRTRVEASRAYRNAVAMQDEVGRTIDVDLGSVTGWGQWLIRLNSGHDLPALQSLAVRASEEWDPYSYITDLTQTHQVADLLLAERSAEASEALRCSVPYLLQFFLHRIGPKREFRGIYEGLFTLLGGEETFSVIDAEALLELAEAAVSLGMPVGDYTQLVHDLGDFLDRLRSKDGLAWGLDVLDELLDLPSPDEGARQSFTSRLVAMAHRPDVRANRTQLRVLEGLAAIVEIEVSFPESEAEDTEASTEADALLALHGKTIAIYTLTEGVSQRAEAQLKKLIPGCKVLTSHEKVASDRLVQYSKQADLFVVVSRSAKHAATDAIRANRGALPLLYARGKGTSSVIEALREWSEGMMLAA